jgi:hypothetical protein
MSSAEHRPLTGTSAMSSDDLWKVLARLDTIVGAVNAKSSFLIAYNTFIIGTILLKWGSLNGDLSRNVQIFLSSALVGVLVVSFLSLTFTFCAASPFLRSPRRPNQYHSLLFFGHIHEHPSPEDYWQDVKSAGIDVARDLAFQIHAMADAASRKTSMIRRSVSLILVAQIPLVALVALIKVMTLFVRTT